MAIVKVTMSTDGFERRVRSRVTSAVKLAIQDVTSEARVKSPVDTGRLSANWRSRFDGTSGEIINATPYAAYQEFGTIKQAGREMIGWRSGTTGRRIAIKAQGRF
jgi:hypothetical protein